MIISVDIGGTKLLAGIVSYKEKKVVEKVKKQDYKSRLLDTLKEAIDELMQRSIPIKKIVIGFPGFVDEEGNVTCGPNVEGLLRFPLKEFIEDKFSLPTKIVNDALLFTIGEWQYGAAKNKDNVVGITLGTGIGGGVIMRGLPKEDGSELGHQVILADADVYCGCGKRGCLEALCSVKQIKNVYMLQTNEYLDIFEIADRIGTDERAKHVFDTAAKYLAVGLSNIIHIFYPQVIVIGGSGGKLYYLIDQAKKELKNMLMYEEYYSVEVLPSLLNADAHLLGGLYYY